MQARHSTWIFAPLAIAALLSACGGGSSGGSVSTLPPSIRYPSQNNTFVVGASIAVMRPIVTSSVSGFTVTPPLPAGLSIDARGGMIFGAPTMVSPATNYRVEASSASGTVATNFTLTVIDQVPEVSYSPDSWDFVQNVAVPEIRPIVSGGAVVEWSIDRPLPAGLTFDTTDGRISGTPTEVSARSTYRVNASNTGGTTSTTLTVSVQAATGTVLAVLHAAETADCTSTCDRGPVVGRPPSAARGVTDVVLDGNQLTLLDRVSGTPLWRIEVPADVRWWQLARDGSYLVVADRTSLGVWSPTGALLFNKEADYGEALAFAAPGELRIGAGPAGAQVIETIAVPAGDSRLSVPHLGAFRAWSEDGERFAASSGDHVWIYSRDAVQLEFAQRISPFEQTLRPAGGPARSCRVFPPELRRASRFGSRVPFDTCL